jgi:hypothetical protein
MFSRIRPHTGDTVAPRPRRLPGPELSGHVPARVAGLPSGAVAPYLAVTTARVPQEVPMFSAVRPQRGDNVARGLKRSATDVLAYLHPDLCATLASLHGAPRSVAEATVQLLPFGSRAALETLNPPLAIAGECIDDEGHRHLALTPFAYEVMAAAAATAEADPQAVDEWSERARLAARKTAEHESHTRP